VSRVSGKPFFVYVLWSVSGRRFYIGVSEDPEHRIIQHNSQSVGWTARHRPWRLVLVERHPDYRTARQREMFLKAQKGGRGFFQATGLDPGDFPRIKFFPGS